MLYTLGNNRAVWAYWEREARGQGKQIGRRKHDTVRVLELRAQGWSWSAIAKELGAGLGTVHRAGAEAKGGKSGRALEPRP